MNKESKPTVADQALLRVAVPVPLRATFDFLMPEDGALQSDSLLGCRVLVPFGRRTLVGVILGQPQVSDVPREKLRHALRILEATPSLDVKQLKLGEWVAGYYCTPIGEVLQLMLPPALRKDQDLIPAKVSQWHITEAGRSQPLDDLQRAPLQKAIFTKLLEKESLLAADFSEFSSSWKNAIESLIRRGWVEHRQHLPVPSKDQVNDKPVKLNLNTSQTEAVKLLASDIDDEQFATSLLFGVTGSGKTEVYFELIERAMAKQQQVLVLVPEIGLTPNLLARFKSRFSDVVQVIHSGLSDKERHLAWWFAKSGAASIIIGTRTSVFTGFKNLGLIIIDEEHDGSFKQQDGVRYHARDTAIYRAKQLDIPIVLGSATPSLESFHNATNGKYRLVRLPQRVNDVPLPEILFVDLDKEPVHDGISPALLTSIKKHFSVGQQSLIFLNRRGYAPAVYCSACKAIERCHRCDANLTLHRAQGRLRCHHCGYERRVNDKCSSCGATELKELGDGTQRIEASLTERLPDARLQRIDRDSTSAVGALEHQLTAASEGEIDILIGTQLVTKGHDFPNLAFVGVVEADQGLFSTDFRAAEHLFQQLVQVAGRAGRREQQGQVLIQTRFSTHDFYHSVKSQDYEAFAVKELQQRMSFGLPPFGFLGLWRAESVHEAKAMQFLRALKHHMPVDPDVTIMDPVGAPMAKRAGRYRAHLLLQSSSRKSLHQSLVTGLNAIGESSELKRQAGQVRWSVDVDPQDMY
ncbi:MAG: primosomal protein N' [Pseudomonadota bacterium]